VHGGESRRKFHVQNVPWNNQLFTNTNGKLDRKTRKKCQDPITLQTLYHDFLDTDFRNSINLIFD